LGFNIEFQLKLRLPNIQKLFFKEKPMFLGIYHFEGDTAQLRMAYERMLELIPHTNLQLHVCVPSEDGLSIIDSCPNKESFLSFASSSEFADALKTAGLPTPKVTPMGEIHTAFVDGNRIV